MSPCSLRVNRSQWCPRPDYCWGVDFKSPIFFPGTASQISRCSAAIEFPAPLAKNRRLASGDKTRSGIPSETMGIDHNCFPVSVSNRPNFSPTIANSFPSAENPISHNPCGNRAIVRTAFMSVMLHSRRENLSLPTREKSRINSQLSGRTIIENNPVLEALSHWNDLSCHRIPPMFNPFLR